MRIVRINSHLQAYLLLALLLAGCALNPHADHEQAEAIAAPAHLAPHLRATPDFVLSTRERIGQAGADLTVYLEGDGLAWLSRSRPSPDPTPDDPVALRLAALDNAPNVAWIARPCQYTPLARNPECRAFYWTKGRFSEAVVAATDSALTAIKQAAGAQRIHLVGYSGGGGLAVLVAARRSDVATLRTLAGNLDHRVFTSLHGVSPLDASLNPADFAARVAKIPQIHYIGENDKVIPETIALAYLRQMGKTRCAVLRTLPTLTHSEGWTSAWLEFVGRLPNCE